MRSSSPLALYEQFLIKLLFYRLFLQKIALERMLASKALEPEEDLDFPCSTEPEESAFFLKPSPEENGISVESLSETPHYGARYYDPRTSVWQSPDPILEKYLPTGNPKKDSKLPGGGGILNSANLGTFSYSHQNPVKYIDPNGQASSGHPLRRMRPTHQIIIERTLKGQVSRSLMERIKSQQYIIDNDQSAASAHKHANVGEGRTRKESIRSANKFLRTELKKAIRSRREGDDDKITGERLGNVLHTAQDAVSPAHIGFSRVEGYVGNRGLLTYHMSVGKEYKGDFVTHGPFEGSKAKDELEGVTQYIFDIYSGKEAIPKNFFDLNGIFILPEKYYKNIEHKPDYVLPLKKKK